MEPGRRWPGTARPKPEKTEWDVSEPDVKLHDDRQTVTITFATTPAATLKLDAPAIEKLLHRLGECRARMVPEVPLTVPERPSGPTYTDFRWATAPDQLHGCVFLHIRDRRFGWIYNILWRDEARRLAGSIEKDAEITPWVPEAKKGYWLAQVDVTDADAYQAYAAANQAAFRRYGGRYLVRAGQSLAVEGSRRSRLVVIEFPDYDTALACYRSAEYQHALSLRKGHAVADIAIAEGYDGAQP